LGASRPSPCRLRSSIVLSLRSVTERRSNTATNFTRDSGELEARSLATDQGRTSSSGPRCIYSCNFSHPGHVVSSRAAGAPS
jgi:hypothetical protein